MKVLHNSQDAFYRKPLGAARCGDRVQLGLVLEGCEIETEVWLRLWSDKGEELIAMTVEDERAKLYKATITMPEEPGILWYYFILETPKGAWYYGNLEDMLGGQGKRYKQPPPSFQITVSRNFSVPHWYKNRIMYQIFPDSFRNGNKDGRVNSPKPNTYIQSSWENTPIYHKDSCGKIARWSFFGGNLKGITEKLDYLKELSVGLLYLNPIFEAASPHRYDTGDYMKIDGVLGTLDDFDELVAECKKRDIGIILDGVFSHTGANSRYFNKFGAYGPCGAYRDKESPYYPWYRFEEYPDKYQCWWGVDDLPNVDEMEESYRRFIYEDENSVIRYWLRRGVSGFRLDVADELPEEFIKGIRRAMEEENPETVLIGEVWEDASNKVSYGEMRKYFSGDCLHSVMNYPFYNIFLDFALGRVGSGQTARRMRSIYENYPEDASMAAMNLLGSHDRARLLTLLSGDESLPEDIPGEGKCREAKERLKMLVGLQMLIPGTPSIYYGDEAGLKGGTDPENRATYPWGKEDPWILESYKEFTNLRKSKAERFFDLLPEINCGDTQVEPSMSEDVLRLSYSGSQGKAYVFVNRNSSREASVTFKVDGSEKRVEIPPLTTIFVCDKDR